MRTTATDLLLTSDGDLQITDGDITLVSGVSFVGQQIRNRLKTVNPDWFYDKIGADLEDLFGLPDPDTACDLAKNKIEYALTYDGFLALDDLYIEARILSPHQILIFVFANTGGEEPLGFEVDLGLGSGLKIREVV
jgi:hypothetical protein